MGSNLIFPGLAALVVLILRVMLPINKLAMLLAFRFGVLQTPRITLVSHQHNLSIQILSCIFDPMGIQEHRRSWKIHY